MTATDVAEVVANVVAVLAVAGLRVVEHIVGIVVDAVHCCLAGCSMHRFHSSNRNSL